MEIYHMADIIPLLQLPPPPPGRSSYYVPCPRCDKEGRRKDKHLNINLEKDVFRCPKCGFFGGVFDLYAAYTHYCRENIREAIKRDLGRDYLDTANYARTRARQAATEPPTPKESFVMDVAARHAAYSALLNKLSLAPDHTQNLLRRGLDEAAIVNHEYRTTPVVGLRALAKLLTDKGVTLNGVPGFFKTISGEWSFAHTGRGILVPVRDINYRIQGLQLRLDNAENRKYRWISSAGKERGYGAEGWVHIAGGITDKVLLIEGPMKADIVHHLTGKTVVAVPGVNSLKHLEKTLNLLIELGVKHVMTAFDMDFLKNWHVQAGYNELVALLGRLPLTFGTYLWNPDYNGLDDYIWECRMGQRRGS